MPIVQNEIGWKSIASMVHQEN